MLGDHDLCGLPEEGAHEKSPKCLGGNLGDFWGDFAKVSVFVYYTGEHYAPNHCRQQGAGHPRSHGARIWWVCAVRWKIMTHRCCAWGRM